MASAKMTFSRDDILAWLAAVPGFQASQVTGVSVKNGIAALTLAGDRSSEALRVAVEERLKSMAGVTEAYVVLTSEKPDAATLATAGKGEGLAQVRHIIAVASGKGGVGKSTVAVNLALALQASGLQTGLLDADIYGPSVPRLLGLVGKPETDGQMLKPKQAFGIKAMSIGLLVDPDTAMIWRGPMATSALMQMMTDVDWGKLDVLVLDLPPGTGDIQLTLAQRAKLAGAVIVSTPQDIALIDARKAISMFAKVNVPVLGVVENMSYFHCPACDTRADIFGHGGARATAAELGVAFLGEVPLHMDIRSSSDAGEPVVAAQPTSANAVAFADIASRVRQALDVTQKTAPTLSIVA
jgi:ATP-binding protein involved in chromosome partitioning